jgi:hypothetical protein
MKELLTPRQVAHSIGVGEASLKGLDDLPISILQITLGEKPVPAAQDRLRGAFRFLRRPELRILERNCGRFSPVHGAFRAAV